MDSGGELVGKVVICMLTDGTPQAAGQAIGYFDGPVYNVSGKPWLATLTRAATPEEEIDYWRKRAEQAEAAARSTASLEGGA